jgi:hypothetical protein
MKRRAPALSLILLCLAPSARAAPEVGNAFFLANAHNAETTISIASDSRGFGLAWANAGNIRFQLLGPRAIIEGSPLEVGTIATNDVLYSVTTPRDPTVIGRESGYAAFWTDSTDQFIPPSTHSPSWSPQGALIDPMGVVRPFMFEAVRDGLPHDARMASISDGFATLESHALILQSGVSGTASVRFYDVAGTHLATLDVPLALRPPVTLSPAGIVSAGPTIFFAWVDNDGLHFAVVLQGNLKPVTGTALAQAAYPLSLATNGSDYLAVWRTETGSTLAARVGGDGTVLDSAPISLDAALPGDTSTQIAAIASEGTTYLVLAAGGSDGSVRGVRIASDGSLLDRAGFQIDAARHASLAPAGGGTWLVALLGDDGIIRGRFVGVAPLPSAPHNVEPPSETDAGFGGMSLDAAAPSAPNDAGSGAPANDAAAAPSAPANDAAAAPSTEDASRTSSRRPAASPKSSSSCGCHLVASRRDPVAVPVLFALLALAGCVRRRGIMTLLEPLSSLLG